MAIKALAAVSSGSPRGRSAQQHEASSSSRETGVSLFISNIFSGTRITSGMLMMSASGGRVLKRAASFRVALTKGIHYRRGACKEPATRFNLAGRVLLSRRRTAVPSAF